MHLHRCCERLGAGLSEEQLLEQFAATRKASTGLAMASTERKQVVLQSLATLLEQNSPQILAANQVDMDAMALDINGTVIEKIENTHTAFDANEDTLEDTLDELEEAVTGPIALAMNVDEAPLDDPTSP